jgi:hypothetical protein
MTTVVLAERSRKLFEKGKEKIGIYVHFERFFPVFFDPGAF